MDTLTELLQFLNINQRFDLKAVALSNILNLTASSEGISLILNSNEFIKSLVILTEDNSTAISTIALKCLINLTASEEGSNKVYNLSSENQESEKSLDIFSKAINSILNENSDTATLWVMILNNLTVVDSLREKILTKLKDGKEISKLVDAFAKTDYNKKGLSLDLLGTVFHNLTSSPIGREIFCQNNCNFLEKIIPFTSYDGSKDRKQGVIGVLKNLSLDLSYHDCILNDRDDDILSQLLYPLTGPEQFTDEENEKFPINLQYLEDDKKREQNPELRLMLLETLLQFCATKNSREYLRSKGTYEILRELHKWEHKIGKNYKCLLACENIIHILIKKEDEIGVDNLKDVDVPEDLSKQFEEDDKTYLENLIEK